MKIVDYTAARKVRINSKKNEEFLFFMDRNS